MVLKSLKVSQKAVNLLYECRAIILSKDPQQKSSVDNILKKVCTYFKNNKGE